MMEPIKKITGRGLPLIIDDVDTDRIIPARFLRTVTFEGIGENVFCDERFDPNGKETDFPMNNPIYKGADIILSGNNFGCGSSREHAPQAIKRAGFKAVIAESFAEIFFGNSTTLGLPCISMKKADIAAMARHIAAQPKHDIVIDMVAKTVMCNGQIYNFTIPATALQALVSGTYDLLAELLGNKVKIEEVNKKLSY